MSGHILLIGALLGASAAGPSQSQASDAEQRWRLPLEQKMRVIQRDISARHLVEGCYVPTVTIPGDGGPVDHTTTGRTGDMHSSSWTGCYLLGQAFRYGWARQHGSQADVDRAFDLASEAVHGLDVLTHVSGKPGLLARKVVYGHGLATEERYGLNERNEWHQGVSEYSNLRFRGHPSHHNYHHVLRGLAIWYYFLQKDNPDPAPREQAQLDKVRSIYTEMMDYGYKAHDMTLMTVDGRYSASLARRPRSGRISTGGIMATNCLKFGYWITGDKWYRDKYDEIVEQAEYKQAARWGQEKWRGQRPASNDDTEHTMPSLWLVLKLEEDPELRAFYRKAVTWLFENKKDLKRSPFNYFYAEVSQDLQGADLPGALETLQLYPSVTVLLPLMNSIRTDLDTARNAAGVLPFNDQPLDNSYDWKGDPFRLDSYLAQPIAALAVSDEDPMVWFIGHRNGALYQSLDGGQSLMAVGFRQNAAVRDVTFAGNKNRIAVLATSRGIFSTSTGGGSGNNWQLAQAGDARRVMVDTRNPNVVWAVMRDGVYRSVDFGMEEVGKAWERVSGPMPAGGDIVYGLTTSATPTMYAAIGGRTYRRGVDDSEWTMSPVDTEDYHVIPEFQQIAISPQDPKTVLFLLNLKVWGRERTVVLRTRDGGKTLTIVGIESRRRTIPSEGSGLDGTEITALTIDPNNAGTVYGTSPKGVYRSNDGGTTWAQCNTGLRIPYAFRVFAPKQLPGKVFVSTPAGLHVSEDGGDSWSTPLLRAGVDKYERGGLGYLTGYWPGRYFGFITEEQANASPEDWGR